MSLYETGNWSHEQQRIRREREALEADAQNAVGPIRNVTDMPDSALAAIVRRATVALSPSPKDNTND